MKLIGKFHVMPMHLACCRHSIGNLNHTKPWVAQYMNPIHMKITSTQELYKQQHFKLILQSFVQSAKSVPCKETPSLQRHLQKKIPCMYLACCRHNTRYKNHTRPRVAQYLNLHEANSKQELYMYQRIKPILQSFVQAAKSNSM